jgi:hypothetical protein
MLNLDIKKLCRIDGVGNRISIDRTGQSHRSARREAVGWEFAHVAIDDASRRSMTKSRQRRRLPKDALAYDGSLSVTVDRVMTDNDSCHKAFDLPRRRLLQRGAAALSCRARQPCLVEQGSAPP